ncbi:MAG TPA: hypothetical protein PK228_20560 [Saprospiraceae bacterium]|nr:hypothetical protein [Saprospiraceae bacterium]
MTAQYLWIAGSLMFLWLGTVHLYYTFFTNRFLAKDPETVQGMKNTHPLLTNRTTMWDAWVGFNASHSMGAIFLGIINIILASQYLYVLKDSFSMLLLTMVTVLFYLFLAKKYWFKIPLAGIAVATICYGIATILMLSE